MSAVGLVGDAWQLLLLVGALAGLAIAIGAIVRHPGFGLALTAIFPIIIWESPVAPALVTLQGITIYADDAVALMLAGAALVNTIRGSVRLATVHLAAIGLAIAMILSTLTGTQNFPIGSTLVEARQLLFVAIAILWGFTLEWTRSGERSELLRRYAWWVLGALVLVALYHGVRYGIGTADDLLSNSSGEIVQTGRVLTSGQAALLGMCAIVIVGTAPSERRGPSTSAAVFAGAVLLMSQQRTAIIAVVAAAVLYWLAAGARSKLNGILVLGGVTLTAIVVAASGALNGFLSDLGTSAGSTGTYEGRQAGWMALLADARGQGAGAVLFGRPFGSGFGRFENGRWVEYAPHNFYLTIFLRVGLVGLALLAVFLVAALRQAWRRSTPRWVGALWVVVVIFGWSYTWPWYLLPLPVIALAQPLLRHRVVARRVTSSHRRQSSSGRPQLRGVGA